MKLYLYACFVLICVKTTTGQKGKTKWKPKGRTLKQLESTVGFSETEFTNLKIKVPKLKKLMAEFYGVSKSFKIKSYIFGDIALTEEQVDALTLDFEAKLKRRRKRGGMAVFSNIPNSKWPFPIHYVINTDYGVNQSVAESKILSAIAHWEANTCIRFERLDITDAEENYRNKHHIVITNFFGCYSMIGRYALPEAQIIAVGEVSCEPFEGIVIHEIGHALGLFHEQNRIDSDQYVSINADNLSPGHMVNFEPWGNPDQITDHGTDFDFGSMMAYGPYAFANDPNQRTIDPIDPRFRNTIGQRIKLSFLDIKTANMEYCSDVCSQTITCQRGGIQDPNNCDRCICPEGFGGTYCDLVAQDSDTDCSPYTTSAISATSTVQCLRSPSYGSGGYTYGAKCSWVLQAPTGKRIKMFFQNSFGLYANPETSCFHWVEVKFTGNLHLGPRFCIGPAPIGDIISESNEAVVVFRSDYETEPAQNTGFELCYVLYEEVTGTTTTSTTTPPPATTTTAKPCPNKVLNCDSFFNDWILKTIPGTRKRKRRKMVIGPGYNCTKGNFLTTEDVTVLINLPGNAPFVTHKLCVRTVAVNSTIVRFGYSAGGTPIEYDMGTDHCLDFGTDGFPTSNSMQIIFTHSLLVEKLEIYDLDIEACV